MNSHTRMKTVVWVMFILALAVGFKPGYVKDLEQFATQVKSGVNPDELQSWATNLISKTMSDPYRKEIIRNTFEVDRADVPTYVRTIYKDDPPEWVLVDYGDIDRYVE